MRILMLSQSYLPVLGGLQTVAHSLACHLIRQGHDIQVVSNRYPRHLASREMLEGVPVRRWAFLDPQLKQLPHRPSHFLAAMYLHCRNRIRLNHLVRAFRPDTINVHFPDVQIPAVLRLRRNFQFRLVVSLHGHDVERFGKTAPRESNPKTPPNSKGLSDILKQADSVTACSRHLLEEAIQLEPTVVRKGIAISNGIDPSRFAERASHEHPRPYIFAFGRLTHKKGFDLLLQALGRLGAASLSADLILAGTGEEQVPLQAQATRLGLEERVHFFGRATPGEIVRLLNGSRFVVVPSRSEPFGIVALEALAAGRPILATRVGGLQDFLSDVCKSAHTGHHNDSAEPELTSSASRPSVKMVEPTVDSLEQGLREWLSPEYKPVGDPLKREHVLEEYSWIHVAQRYAQVFAG